MVTTQSSSSITRTTSGSSSSNRLQQAITAKPTALSQAIQSRASTPTPSKTSPTGYVNKTGPVSYSPSRSSGGRSTSSKAVQQITQGPSNVLTQAISSKAPSTSGKSQVVVTENYTDRQRTDVNIQRGSTMASYVNQGAALANQPAQRVITEKEYQEKPSSFAESLVVRSKGGSYIASPLPTSISMGETDTSKFSSIQPYNINQPAGTFLSQGFFQSTKQSAQILASNIKYNVGAAFSDKPYYWQSVGSPFKLSGKYEAELPNVARGIKSGTISTSVEPYYTKLETRQMDFKVETSKEGVTFNIPSTSDLYVRTGEKYFQEAKSIGSGVALAGVSAVAPEVLGIYGVKEIQQYSQQIFNPQLTSEQRTTAGIKTGFGILMFTGGIKGSFIQAEIAQVKATQEYLQELNRVPITGKAQYLEGSIKYSFNRNIITDSGKLISSGESQFQLTGPNTFRGFGIQDTTLSVKGVWSGNIYTGSQSTLSVISSGKIYQSLGEVNPSISNPVFKLDFFKSQSTLMPGKSYISKSNIDTKNWYSIPVAGRTTQQGQFLLTESGQIGRMNINKQLGFTEGQLVENTKVSALIQKGGRGIFKLEPLKTKDIQGGLGSVAGGTTSPVQQFGELTKISPFTTPITPSISMPTTSLTSSLITSGTSSSLKLTSQISSSQRNELKISAKPSSTYQLLSTGTTNALQQKPFNIIGTTTKVSTITKTDQISQQITSQGSGFSSSNIIMPDIIPPVVTPIIGFPDISFGGFALPNLRKYKPKKQEFRIAPSFTGIITGIKLKDSLKVSKTFGVSPTQFRGLAPTSKKGKSKPYFKFIDL